jgi:flagellar hook protein FlgE
MFQALYNSLSGLFSYSQALDVVSNNVANMNTPGFRGADSFFENVGDGLGTHITGKGIRTVSGSLSQTGTPTDLALTGNGYFILQDAGGNLYYTRAGQFRFNAQGLLTDSVTGYDVMAIDAAGNLSPINLTPYQTFPGVATTSVNMTGNIDPGTPANNNVQPPTQYTPSPTFTTPNVNFYDASGTQHALTVTISDTTTDPTGVESTFAVTVMFGSLKVGSGNLEFSGGSLNSSAPITASVTIGGKLQTIALNFSNPTDPNSSVTNNAPSSSQTSQTNPSNVTGTATDGSAPLGISTLSFDTNGVLQLQYSSTQNKTGPQIALASFNSDDALQMIGGRLVAGTSVNQHTFGHAGEGDFGTITGGSLELSNVDLTQEFANMIIIQRGYQASSKVMTVSNQMIEDLYNNAQGGG